MAIPIAGFAAEEGDYWEKPYDGPYNHPEVGTDKAAPVLKVNGVPISPIADDQTDVLITVCDGPQEWNLLKEYTNWKDVNRFGFYDDLGVGTNQTLLFAGFRDEGYSVITTVPSGTQLGLFLHNDTDGDTVFSGNDSYLFSERSLTYGSGANEHQWFMVYDVSSYKGTGATYYFDCNTEDYTTTGDFDYLIFMDDDHTSANFDHNDMIVGITCTDDPCWENTAPVCNLPANGTYSVTGDSTFTFPVSATDADGNLAGCSLVSGDGSFDGTNWTFTTSGAGVYSADFECADECGATCSGTVEITVGYNHPPQTTTPPQDTTVLSCVTAGDLTVGGFDVSDPDGNLDYVTADPGTYDNGEVTFYVDTAGTYTITLIAVDTEGLADTSVVDIIVNINQPPVATCFGSKNDTTIFVCSTQDEICLTGFSCDDPDGNLATCSAVGGTLNGDEICFTPVAGTNTLKLIATDECGLADTCVTTVYVVPNSPPSVTCPGDQDLFVCDLSPITIGGFVCDDPDDNLSTCSVNTGTLSGGEVTFTPVVGDNEIILTAVDECGKTKACTTLVTVTLNSPPSATCPGDQTLEVCNLDPITIGGFVCDDPDGNLTNCAVDNGTLSGGDVTFTPVAGVNTITLTATDDCDETATCTATITVNLNNPPTATCPGDQTLEVCSLDPITISGFICDDPDGNLTDCSVDNGTLSGGDVTFTPVAGDNTITLTATDDCGETATCTTTITVNLNSPPTATCPGDQDLFVCDLSPITIGGFVCDDVDGNLATCSVDNGTLSGGDVTFTPVVGANTINLTATDDCGATATCTVNINVSMNNPPTASCPSTQDLFVCDLSPITVSGFLCDDPDGNLTNCAVDNGTLSGGDVTFTPVAGANTITLTATDACGETATCTATINIAMNNAPTVTCPGDQTLEVCSLDPITISGFVCDDVDGNLTNCAVDNGTLSGGDVTFTPVAGANTITLTATDDCDETATCTTTITVNLNNPPTATCPGDQTLEVCSLDPITISGFVCDDPDGNLTNCAVDNGTLSGGDVTFTPVAGDNTITLTATDDCGETATCTTTITVDLNNPPSATCPGDQDLFVCDLSPITIGGFVCDDPDGNLATCSVDNGTLLGGDVTFTPVLGQNSITLTATDDCGATATCTVNINIAMNNPPTASCPSTQDLFVCDLSPITVSGFLCDDPDGNLTNCSVDNGTLSGGDVTFTPVAGANTITLTATDACGETASCTATINVTLNTAPTATCPGDQSLSVCNLDPITIDGFICDDIDGNLLNCSVDNGTLSGTSVTFTPVQGTNTITLTAIDDCDETATCMTTITVDANLPPTVTCPGDQDLLVCDLSPITIDGFGCDDPEGNLVSCSVDNGTLVGSEVTFTPVAGANAITLTAVDDCGNQATCTATINVTLNSPPTTSCPDDVEFVVCQELEIPFDGFICDDPDGNLVSCTVDNGTLDGTVVYFTPGPGVNTITLTATDACGEVSTSTMTITTTDNAPPTATCPDDVTLNVCDLSDICLDGFIAEDIDDNIAETLVDNGTLDGTTVCFTPVAGENIINFTVQDWCEEQVTCQTVVNVVVNQPPTVQVPADQDMFVCDLSPITINGFSCDDPDGNLISCEVDNGTLNGSGVTFTPTEGINSITLTATDDCGETSSATVNIDVSLNSEPTVTCPNDTTLYMFELAEVCLGPFVCDDPDGNLASCDITGGTQDGDNICFDPVEGNNVITVTATDDCGATATCETNVEVVLVSSCPMVTIEKREKVIQGQYEDVLVSITNAQYEMGGYDFLIAYDASALTFMQAAQTGFPDACGWEYFTYRFGPTGNCDGGCPSGMLRVFALAEYNNGADHPDCYIPPDAGEYGLFTLRFFVSDNRTFECQYVPIKFFWYDCGDNAISSRTGDTTFVDRAIYNFKGEVIWDEDDDFAFPETERQMFLGAPDQCLINPMPDKPSPIRCIDFTNGGIDIVCADSIDARGDINLNGIAYEVSDAVVFTNYFISGFNAFVINRDGQTAASDANADGIPLSVADLVYIIRVVTGDALPYDKLTPDADLARFNLTGGALRTDAEIAAAHIVLDGEASVEPGIDASHMDIKVGYYDGNTHVVIYSFDKGAVFGGEILRTDGRIVSIEASDYVGNSYRIGKLPTQFALTSYPNPFNPSTNIELTLPSEMNWNIEVFNVNGQRVAEYSGRDEAGTVSVVWDARGMSTGIYFVKACVGGQTATRKLVLLK